MAKQAGGGGRTRLVVLDFTANGVESGAVKTIAETVSETLQHQKIVDDVVSASDLRAMVDVEGTKREAGCDQSDACLAEIAAALGANFIVHGSVGRLGALYVVNLNLFDARANRAIARERAQADRLEQLPAEVESATDRLARTYSGKSADIPAWTWIGGGIATGGAAVLAISGFVTYSAYTTVRDPTSLGATKATGQGQYVAGVIGIAGGSVLAIAGATIAVVSSSLE
ncbi:MAG TPA: hypothetical protein VGO62_05595 [Myxococcota bacterium]